MTFVYQPSAAGISWLTLAQTLDSRAQMEKALLALSGENSIVQINMTEHSADQTLKELNAAAEGQKQNAIFTMTGAGAGAVMSGVTLYGAVKHMPQEETQTLKNSLGVEKVDEIEMTPLKQEMSEETGIAQATGQKTSSSPSSSAPTSKDTSVANENKTPASRNPYYEYFTNHGSLLSQSLQTGIQSFGGIQQATYTAKQAEAKSIEVIAQGLASVMNAQGQMLSSAVGSCDTFSNNMEGAITTIIQVSAIRA